ncbi:MAG: sterol desaturase family protein [Crocinitomicaceae bacterium]|nr:sterol desaturase family protein [Crocinitomicaceae bacterium]
MSTTTQKEKTRRFRKKFMAENHLWYSGWPHYLINGTLLFGSCVFLFIQIEELRLIELLAIPVTLVLGSLFVYLVHRYPLHQKYKPVRKQTYDQHTLIHHRFYTNELYQVEPDEEYNSTLFPPAVVLGFCIVFLPGLYFLTRLFLPLNVVYLFVGTSSFYFILYEVVHYISHLSINHWLMRIGYFRRMRKHHLDHHDPRLMEKYNFNIVIPLFDFVFGTKKVVSE